MKIDKAIQFSTKGNVHKNRKYLYNMYVCWYLYVHLLADLSNNIWLAKATGKGAKRDEEMKSKPEIDRQRRRTDRKQSRQRQHRLLPYTLPHSTTLYLWQPLWPRRSQPSFVCVLCTLELLLIQHSFTCWRIPGRQPTVCPSICMSVSLSVPLSTTAVRLVLRLVSIFKYFPLTDFTIFHFHTLSFLAVSHGPTSNTSIFLLLIVHSFGRSFSAYASPSPSPSPSLLTHSQHLLVAFFYFGSAAIDV